MWLVERPSRFQVLVSACMYANSRTKSSASAGVLFSTTSTFPVSSEQYNFGRPDAPLRALRVLLRLM
jgi:hypothetical protein